MRKKSVVQWLFLCICVLMAACGPSGSKAPVAQTPVLVGSQVRAPASLDLVVAGPNDPLVLGVAVPNDSPMLTFTGWSISEKSHRWSVGKTSSIGFFVSSSSLGARNIVLVGGPYGPQRLRLLLNGKQLATTKLNPTKASREFAFSLPSGVLREGINTLQLETPDAKQAGPKDPQIISFALGSFILR